MVVWSVINVMYHVCLLLFYFELKHPSAPQQGRVLFKVLRHPSPPAALWLRVEIWNLLPQPLPLIPRCHPCHLGLGKPCWKHLILLIDCSHIFNETVFFFSHAPPPLLCFSIEAMLTCRTHFLMGMTLLFLGRTWHQILPTRLAWILQTCKGAWAPTNQTRTPLVTCGKVGTRHQLVVNEWCHLLI